MRLFEEGKEAVRGGLDKNYIWVLIGTVLYKASREERVLKKVTAIPKDFCSKRHWGFNMRTDGESILLFSSVKPAVWKLDKNELSYNTFNLGFAEEEKDYFVQPLGEGRNLLTSFRDGNMVIFDNKGKFDNLTECIREIKKELKSRHLHFRNIRYSGTQVEGNELIVGVRTEERDVFAFLDRQSLRMSQMIDPMPASEKLTDFLYDGVFLWLRSKGKVNQIIKYDMKENRVCKSIDLPEGFERRVLLRKANKKIFLIAIKGNIGIIDEDKNEIRILQSGSYIPLDIDTKSSIRVLCKDERSIYLFELKENEMEETAVIPLKKGLDVLLDMVI